MTLPLLLLAGLAAPGVARAADAAPIHLDVQRVVEAGRVVMVDVPDLAAIPAWSTDPLPAGTRGTFVACSAERRRDRASLVLLGPLPELHRAHPSMVFHLHRAKAGRVIAGTCEASTADGRPVAITYRFTVVAPGDAGDSPAAPEGGAS